MAKNTEPPKYSRPKQVYVFPEEGISVLAVDQDEAFKLKEQKEKESK